VNESVPNPNVPPDNLDSTGTLVIRENEPIGTFVGLFSADDPDANGSLTYALHDSNGTPGNQNFTLDLNGTLRTAVILDYEANASHLIRVRVYDDLQAYVEGNFTVVILDLNEFPINYAPTDITTENELKIGENDRVGTVVGSFGVVDENDFGIHFFALASGEGDADNSLFSLDQNGTLQNATVLSYEQNQTLSIRVWVADSVGNAHEKIFVVLYVAEEEPGETETIISSGADVGAGWKRAGWFGYYFGAFYPWVYHKNLGWLYIVQKSGEDTWFYREGLGWVWTNRHVFPHMYLFKRAEWTYLDRTTWPAKLFDYSYMEWFELDRKYRISISMEPPVGGMVSGVGEYYRWEPVRIEATSQSGYSFNGWAGDLSGNDSVLEFEAVRDLTLRAGFIPAFLSLPTGQAIDSIQQLVDSLDNLSPEEKKEAMLELLLKGESSKAGIDSNQ
jgi:hypothetical protein